MNSGLLSRARLDFFHPPWRARAKIVGSGPKARRGADAFEMEIAGGTRILFRPVTANDRERLRAAFNRLSFESRLSRFFMPIADFSEEMLRYLTEVDQRQHVAWCAIDPALCDQPLVGTVRFVRRRYNPQVAEMSIEVIDAYQHKGIGTTLFCLLYILARWQGLHTLIAEVHPANRKFLNFLRRWGITGRLQDGVIEAEFPIYQDEVLFSQFWPCHEFKSLAEKIQEKLMMSHG
jgi:acetyltransferase